MLECVEPISGYIVRWIITGRGEIHRQIADDKEEVCEGLLAAARSSPGSAQSGETPFIWSETVKIMTGPPIPDLADLLKEDETFQELDRVLKDLRTEEGIKLVTGVLGGVWEEAEEAEEYNSVKMQYRKDDGPNSLASLIEEATQLAVEEIMKRRI